MGKPTEASWYGPLKVIDPNSPFHLQTVFIHINESGVISDIQSEHPAEHLPLKSFEGKHTMVSPGWMDMEVHLNTPGFEFKENLNELAEAAFKGGFTSILCYPNTDPVIDKAIPLQSLKQQSQHLPLNIHFTGCVSEHNKGKELAELYEMHTHGALAFTDGIHPIQREELLGRALRYMRSFDGLMIHHTMSANLMHDGQINEGIMSLQLGMVPIPEVAETSSLLRDLEILAYEEGKMHVQPVSSPKVLDELARKKEELSLSVGMPAYYLHFSEEELVSFDTNLKVIPPLRSKKQIQELLNHTKQGTVDVLTTGHRAQGIEEKQLEFPLAEAGMLGLQTFLHTLNTSLIGKSILSWSEIIEKIAINPRKILQLDIPHINIGSVAELTMFDPDKEWIFNSGDIPSRAKNSPLLGQTLKGKIEGIFVNGQWLSRN
ncbi:MAG: dihydroorotase [Bacteroidota bacterium]